MREKGRERRSGGGREQELSNDTKKHSNFNPDFAGYHHNKQITTFFVTNFPEDVTTDDLWTTFARYWKVGEVYIPKKRDKFDRRFGFARFVEVRDAQKLLERIEGTWIGTYKLRANLSRFNRGELQHRDDSHLKSKVESRVGGRLVDLTNIYLSKELWGWELGVVNVEPIPAALERLKHSFVGVLRDENLADNIHVLIAMEGFQDVKATLLGFDKILLSSSLEDGVLNAIQADKAWWNSKFLEINKWSLDLKASGRRIWVRIFGTPPHVWGWECFNRILNRFGRLSGLDASTDKQSRLDVARAQVVVSSWDFLDESVEILVGKDRFVIRVVEERFGDIDLGVKRCMDPDLFCVGSLADEAASRSPSEAGDCLVNDDGKHDGEERREWIEGWSEQGSDEDLGVGFYPTVLGTAVSDTLNLGSEEVTDKVELEETKQQTTRGEEGVFGDKERNCLEVNPFLALTWIDGEDLGEDLDKRGEEFLSAQEGGGWCLENEERVSRGEREIGYEVDFDFNSNLRDVGHVDSWAGLDNIELGCVKNQNTLKNKDKEVARLKQQYEEEFFAAKTLASGQRNLSKAMKAKKHGGNPISGAIDFVSGMMKAGRFARVIKQSAGGRKGKNGKKKGNKRHTKATVAGSNDSISEESVHLEGLQNRCRKLVPVAALEVVLTE
ncbi:RNA recognition motif, partial [Trifolium medium]|nr:RNA recognition motif [Trifolium medium]